MRKGFKPLKNKYNNKRQEFAGLKFDSGIELRRYQFLLGLQEAGLIEELAVHPRFPLTLPNGVPVLIKGAVKKTHSRYVPDFTYYLCAREGCEAREGLFVVEDVKSVPTAREGYFKLKRALFEALYGVEVTLVFWKKGEWVLNKMAP